MRWTFLALVPLLVAAPVQAGGTAAMPDGAARVQIAQGGPPGDKRREIEKKLEEERREKAEKERKRRAAEARRKAEAGKRRRAEEKRRKRAEAERKRRAARRRGIGGCHRGVPASFRYYTRCAFYGIPWGASEATVRRVLGTPARTHGSGSFRILYFKPPGIYQIEAQFGGASGLKHMEIIPLGWNGGRSPKFIRYTRAVSSSTTAVTLRRLLGSRVTSRDGEHYYYKIPGLQVLWRCMKSTNHVCKWITISKR